MIRGAILADLWIEVIRCFPSMQMNFSFPPTFWHAEISSINLWVCGVIEHTKDDGRNVIVMNGTVNKTYLFRIIPNDAWVIQVRRWAPQDSYDFKLTPLIFGIQNDDFVVHVIYREVEASVKAPKRISKHTVKSTEIIPRVTRFW